MHVFPYKHGIFTLFVFNIITRTLNIDTDKKKCSAFFGIGFSWYQNSVHIHLEGMKGAILPVNLSLT